MRVSGEDLGAILVREGFAWAFTRFSVDYVDQQEEARTANRGVHAHDCVPGCIERLSWLSGVPEKS
jgi:endonuclease YncB( thermonuclease family)